MTVQAEIRSLCENPAFQEQIVGLLLKLCAVDTSPCSDLAAVRERENQVFGIIEGACRQCALPGSRLQRRPIPPTIEDHPAFTIPHYARINGQTETPSAARVYEGRGNLVFLLDGPASPSGVGTALNAHVDVVSPYVPPRQHGDVLVGRGVADDKGNVAAALAALRIVKLLVERKRVVLRNAITAMFVIDEEIGGNGSLALTLDDQLCQRFQSLLVLECTGNTIHVANRGAIYMKAEASLGQHSSPGEAPPVSLVESFCYAILELEKESQGIRAESRHPLFPDQPVYICPGILGPFGAHPSSVCGELTVRLCCHGAGTTIETVTRAVEAGLAVYLSTHADRTQEVDPVTHAPRIERHYTLTEDADRSLLLHVHGTTGHLGAMPRHDAAILKWAYIGRSLIESRLRGVLDFNMEMAGQQPNAPLCFEGAQGFVPTHSIADVSGRIRAAFLQGLVGYLRLTGAAADSFDCTISFDKLHNNAYMSDPASPSVARAVQAATDAGIPQGALLGWNASCDARLFADERPSLSVITCGAGELGFAHSQQEQVSLSQLFQVAQFIALFLLRETGSCE